MFLLAPTCWIGSSVFVPLKTNNTKTKHSQNQAGTQTTRTTVGQKSKTLYASEHPMLAFQNDKTVGRPQKCKSHYQNPSKSKISTTRLLRAGSLARLCCSICWKSPSMARGTTPSCSGDVKEGFTCERLRRQSLGKSLGKAAR